MPVPNPSATRPTIQVGTWNMNTDAFTTVLDLYDNSAWYVMSGGLKMPQPEKVEVRSFNVRTAGELIPKWQYKNRHITVQLRVQASTPANVLANLHTYLAAIENPPYVVRLALPGSSVYKYADVVLCKHDIPSDTMEFLGNTQRNITIDFECKPRLRRDRVWAQNFALNPGAEAPSGTAVTVFNDAIANLNAYRTPYVSTVLGDGPVAFWEMNEPSGSVMVDATGHGWTGSIGVGTTVNQASFNGDTTLASYLMASSFATVGYNASLNTASWSVEGWVKPTAGAGTLRVLASNVNGNTGIQIQATAANAYSVQAGNGASFVTVTGGTATVGSWAYIAATLTGTTLTLYVNGTSVGTGAVTFSANTSAGWFFGSTSGAVSFWPGNLSSFAYYSSAISSGQVSAHYTAGLSGSALAQDVLSFSDVLRNAYGNTLLHYFRMDEASGLVANDVQATGNNGTISATGVAYGTTAILNGDADKSMTFTGASSGNITVPSSGLQAGNSTWSYGFNFQLAAVSGALQYGLAGGTNITKQGFYMGLNTSNIFQGGVIGSNIAAGGAISTGVRHQGILSWDGTTLQLFLDGSSVGTLTPGALSITFGSPGAWIASFISSANFWTGIIKDVWMASSPTNSTNATALWNAANVAPATTANTLLIPAGGRVLIGTSAWKTMNTWRMRFRYTTGGTFTWNPQYTDANNYLSISTTATTLTVSQDVASSVTSLGTASVTLISGIQYWLSITVYPGNQVTATITNDVAGAIGSTTIGTVTTATASSVTVAGPYQMAASGASLGIGGNFSNVHTVGLWGPGGWTFSTAGTYPAIGAWEQVKANCYSGGPVTSYGALRIDTPSMGTVNATWLAGSATSTTTLARDAMPAYANQTIYGVAHVKVPSIGASATIKLQILEYNSSGTLTATNTIATLTGPQASFATMTGNYTTANNTTTAYTLLGIQLADTNAGQSANATLTIDNVQQWDATSTGQTSMAYHELRFPQTPAQYVISGIIGDSTSPVLATLSAYQSGNWVSPTTATFYLGRRTSFNAAAQLVTAPVMNLPNTITPVLSTLAYGGYYLSVAAWATPLGNNIVGYLPFQNLYPGRVHLLGRMQLSSGTPANVTLYPGIGLTTTQILTGVVPFTATGTWGTADLGTMSTTFGQPSAFTSGNNQSSQLVAVADTTAKTLLASSLAAVPDDGETLIYSVIYQTTNATVNGIWLAITQESTTPSTSVISGALNNAWTGYTAATEGQIQVNTLGTEILSLDPTIGGGTNQFVLHALDNTGSPMANMLEVMYSPMDLYP